MGIFAPANGRQELPSCENKITFNKACKIEAIKAAEPPQNAKELNSFLHVCTVQYDDLVLVYFNPSIEQEVHGDGCPLGISATLVQRVPKDDNWWVVQYANRALSETGQNNYYSQTEIEMLAADFTCRKSHIFFCMACQFTICIVIVTDHKPLEVILNKP